MSTSATVLVACFACADLALLATWRARRAARRRPGPADRPPIGTFAVPVPIARGSSRTLADAGALPWRSLLEALAVRPPGSGEPFGGDLGLDEAPAGASTVLHAGVRDGRQVVVRLGADERVQTASSRRGAELVCVRAATPPFTLRSTDGRLVAEGDVPPAVRDLVTRLAPAPGVWRDVRIVGGPDGVVARRPISMRRICGWLYDLWLCERIATVLHAPALAVAPVADEAFAMPYGVGRTAAR